MLSQIISLPSKISHSPVAKFDSHSVQPVAEAAVRCIYKN